MAHTVKDLLSIKKMTYGRLTHRGGGRMESRGGGRGRGDDSDIDYLIIELGNQARHHHRITQLLQEIAYLEANLNSSFESVSFMMTEDEERNINCLAGKDEE